jgi:glycosyltransferase involved in cell wall biosynthesis
VRIGFVIPYFYPAWQYGGTPKSAFELARILARRGHEIKVLTTDSAGQSRLSEGAGPQPVQVEGISVYYYRNVSNYAAFRYRLFWPSALFRAIQDELEGVDLVHVHEFRSTLTVASYRAAEKLGLPCVLSPHGGLKPLGKRFAKGAFDLVYGRSILAHTSVLAAASPQELKDAASFAIESPRARILPNTISPDDFTILPERGAFRAERSLTAAKLVLFLGRLNWIKGADTLLQAAANFRDGNGGIQLVIAGPDDGQEGELRRMAGRLKIHDRVTFTGFLDHRAKLRALVDADVLVIPSRSEVFAIAALEALMCGTPVLMSSACGFHPMPASECGVIQFDAGTTDDLGRQLKLILREPRPKIEVTRRFVDSMFSPAAVAAQAESLYRQAMSPRRGGRRLAGG